MRQGILFVVSAASGTGKTSLLKALLEKVEFDLKLSISYTTRPMRPGEINGVHYHFVSHETFKEMIAGNEFLEYAEVFQHYYGTSKNAVLQQLQEGHDVILEIDWQGAAQICEYFSEAVSIFILPPSIEILKERLLKRGQDSMEVVQQRLEKSRLEISHYADFHYLVINEKFDKALEDLTSIIQAARLEQKRNKIFWQHWAEGVLNP